MSTFPEKSRMFGYSCLTCVDGYLDPPGRVYLTEPHIRTLPKRMRQFWFLFPIMGYLGAPKVAQVDVHNERSLINSSGSLF